MPPPPSPMPQRGWPLVSPKDPCVVPVTGTLASPLASPNHPALCPQAVSDHVSPLPRLPTAPRIKPKLCAMVSHAKGPFLTEVPGLVSEYSPPGVPSSCRAAPLRAPMGCSGVLTPGPHSCRPLSLARVGLLQSHSSPGQFLPTPPHPALGMWAPEHLPCSPSSQSAWGRLRADPPAQRWVSSPSRWPFAFQDYFLLRN